MNSLIIIIIIYNYGALTKKGSTFQTIQIILKAKIYQIQTPISSYERVITCL
jgi:hypothetical protein